MSKILNGQLGRFHSFQSAVENRERSKQKRRSFQKEFSDFVAAFKGQKMFWKYNNINASQIETVLEKENVTLSEILDHEGVIQECKNQTTKLIDL